MLLLSNRAIMIAVVACLTQVSPSIAQTTIDVLHAYPRTAATHAALAEAFQEEHPDIQIKFRAPTPDYAEAMLRLTRESISGSVPDVFFSGFNTIGTLVDILEPRGQIVDLSELLTDEGTEWVQANYADNILELAQSHGKQYGIPFNASVPVVYFNGDLVRQAGGDPENFPDTWDELLKLAHDIDQLGNDIAGLEFSVGVDGADWYWQGLILERGGQMMDAEGTHVAYNNELGLEALRFLRRTAEETNMTVASTRTESQQQFYSGRLGIMFASPAGVSAAVESVGDRFDLRTAAYPIVDRQNGGLAAGGNAAVILSQDEAKRQAAWEYVKFVTGPRGQAIAVQMSGYLPTNKLAAEELASFYAENPIYQTVMTQMPWVRPWYSYPGPNGVEITRVQKNILERVQRGELRPEDGLAELVTATEALLP